MELDDNSKQAAGDVLESGAGEEGFELRAKGGKSLGRIGREQPVVDAHFAVLRIEGQAAPEFGFLFQALARGSRRIVGLPDVFLRGSAQYGAAGIEQTQPSVLLVEAQERLVADEYDTGTVMEMPVVDHVEQRVVGNGAQLDPAMENGDGLGEVDRGWRAGKDFHSHVLDANHAGTAAMRP
ncbi:MAG: hypothetical protein ACRD96_23265 [Bryobacteraceae bacterium]